MLELANVKKSYVEPDGHQLPILDIPSFRVAQGEQVAICGRSGCGKTTLLHAIAGIGSVDSGSIQIDGFDITRLSEAGRDRFRAQKIGYVFQTFNLMTGFSALENILLGMAFTRHSKDSRRANDLLARVGLAHRKSHKPAMLSVGEQQRVAVARSLANKPKVLLADEPTANVDPANQDMIVELIRTSCREENIALLLVTHSREVAAQFERCENLEEINKATEISVS